MILFISGAELVFVCFIVLLVFGADKIPSIAKGLAKGMTQIRQATNEIKTEISKNTEVKSRIPKRVHRTNPCLKAILPREKLPSPSASATRGVMAVLNPIPKDMATNIKLLPKETAASSAVPNCPTIMLSTKATRVWPSIPKITGPASVRLYLNSRV